MAADLAIFAPFAVVLDSVSFPAPDTVGRTLRSLVHLSGLAARTRCAAAAA